MRLHTEAIGEGMPVVVLPGGPGFDHLYLRPGLDPLAGHARIVYVDLRNTGRSEHGPLEEWTLEQAADDVAALCAAEAIESPVVFGHSAGGFVALHLALRHPALLRGLILCETSPTFAPVPDDHPPPSLRERAGPEAADVAARMFAGDVSPETLMGFARLAAPYYSGPAHMDVPPQLFGAGEINHELTQYFFGALASRYDLRARLGEISVPALVTIGAWDWVIPAAKGRVIAGGIRGARLVEFPESGHFPFSEEPELFQGAVREYLAALPRT